MTRFIFVTGGVVSSLGKGIAASALGALLQARGYKVRLRKLDPYLNVDPGTMSPFQHGEVFVTEDGMESDLDLGHYERFTGVDATSSDYTTSGQIYMGVLQKERRGDYLGATVMVVPHIIDEIKNFIKGNLEDEDFVICEIGGTVGDIEGLPFLEAIRQVANDVGRENTLFVHLTLIPYIKTAQELKTKPSQHSVKELLSVGIQPDILLCRSEYPLPESSKHKLGLFCNVKKERVIEALDVSSIYEVPLIYHGQGFDQEVCKYFGLDTSKTPDLSHWEEIIARQKSPDGEVTVGVVGKYVELPDAYKSIIEAFIHAGIANRVKVKILWIDSDNPQTLMEELKTVHGVLVPGGFGTRGTDGKIEAIRFAREKKIPFMGICLGMQLAIVEAARNLVELKDANSTEFAKTDTPVIGLMTEWMDKGSLQQRTQQGDMGGTMRLGAYPCVLEQGSDIAEIYGEEEISERHRHRYEVNTHYREQLEKVGVKFVGMSPDGELPEIIQYVDHPWFFGVQFHPELKSRPFAPHPLFTSFIRAVIDHERLM